MSNTIRAHNGISAVAHNAFVCGNGTNLFPTLDNRYMVLYVDELGPTLDPRDTPVILVRGYAGGPAGGWVETRASHGRAADLGRPH